MISIHSDCLLFDLRSVLSAVREHNTTLGRSAHTYHAEKVLGDLVERIEDAAAFIHSLEAALLAASEADLGKEQF